MSDQSHSHDSGSGEVVAPYEEPTRRDFLASVGAASVVWAGLESWSAYGMAPRKPRVAAIFTEFRFRSHAYNILENFLEPYVFNGKRTSSPVEVVSWYVDQFPEIDTGRAVSKRYGIPIYKTIAEALCCGGDTLDVDAVLLIGEHGEYPYNELEQHLYPRKEFFDQITAVIEKSGRKGIPLFNDKHFSYSWKLAKEMYDEAARLEMPLLAGSSVPLAQRVPPMELPKDAEITEAVSIHGGGVETYDFHGLEVLQSIVEARKGGETGVSRVEFLTGDALWKAADEGRWSIRLAEAAMKAEGDDTPIRKFEGAHGILLEYADGLKATVLRFGSSSIRWNFACQIKGKSEPLATHYYVGPWGNRNLFIALSHAIQEHFVMKKPPYSPERTLLTTGILDAAMHSRHEGKPLATPQLEFAYQPIDFRSVREMGKTWELITKETPETKDVLPGGYARLIEK